VKEFEYDREKIKQLLQDARAKNELETRVRSGILNMVSKFSDVAVGLSEDRLGFRDYADGVIATMESMSKRVFRKSIYDLKA